MSVGTAVKPSRSRTSQSAGWPMNGATAAIEINRCIRPLLDDTTSIVVTPWANDNRNCFRC